MPLEPRIMFDGAAVLTATEAVPAIAAHTDIHADTHAVAEHAVLDKTPAASESPSSNDDGRTVIFVDSRVVDTAQLLQGAPPGTEIVYLNDRQNGLEQIADYLQEHAGAGSIQIVAHGNQGDLWLGGTYLSAENVYDHQGQLAAIGNGLRQGGDVLIYACNTAADDRGLSFVGSLSTLIGRDVAASIDRTGVSGDWDLEIATGRIEAAPVLAPLAYDHDLLTLTVTSNGDNGAGTLRQAIIDATAGDTITFNASMTISLTTVTSGNMLAISKNLTIDGDLNNDGTPDVSLDAQNKGRVLQVSSGTVTLDGLVLTKGLISGNGGGYSSTVGGDALGAGISVSGAGTKVTFLHSTITSNAAAGGGGAGAAGGTYNYGGGGGGGRSSVGGGNGGAYDANISGGTGLNGIGGLGGHNGNTGQAGKGGSTTGGAGGSIVGGFINGGNGATAGPGGGSSIGGGGGGAGASQGQTGGRGGHAAGAIFVGAGATVYMASSTVSSNWGAGGGGGGGYGTAGGNGGDGAGAVRVIGTFKYQNSSMTFSSNSGVGGGAGASHDGTNGNNGNSTNDIRTAGGTTDPNWTPPNSAPTLGTVTANAVSQANAGQSSYSFTVAYSDTDGVINSSTIDTNDVTVSKGVTNLTVSNASWSAGSNTATYTVTPPGGTWDDADNGTWTIAIVANQVADNAGAFVAANASAGSFAVSMDTTGPTVSSVSSSSSNGSYRAGDTIAVTVAFNETSTVTGTPTLTLNSGGTASYASGSGSNTLTFNYTVQAGENAADLDYSATNSLSLSGGTIRDAASNNATLTLPTVGGGSSLGGQKNIVVDTTAPTVSSVSATTANGTYKVGDTIAITVTLAEAVTVTGTPTLTLNSGGTASYASGSGTNTLTFNYTVGAGDSAADLDYSATNSLALSGGTVRDAPGNNATLTLPTVGGGSSLGGQKNIVIDGIAPTLQSDTVPTNATYTTGQNLDFTVTYSEAVTVNTGGGTPYIGVTLNTGGGVQAAYLSGSGTTTLTFRYTVASNNVDNDGIAAANSITLNGGTIRDAAGNNAATTGITFASTANVLVEAVAPTVSSINRVTGATTNATSVDYTVIFSENVSGVDSSDFSLTTTGIATGSIASIAQVNGSTYTVTVNTISGDGTLRLDLKNAGTGITDTPGNAITTGFTSGQTYTIDNTAPAVTSVSVPANATYIAGQNLNFTVNFGENVTVNTGGGTPYIAITLDTGGTVQANYLSGSGTSALVFRYTVASGNLDTNGISVGAAIVANGGTLRDAATNNANLTLNSVGSTTNVLVDAVVPTVSSVNVPPNTNFMAGQNLNFTVNFSENVTVNTGGGTPRIAITLATGTVYANYFSGSGTAALVFRYTTAAGHFDGDGIALAGSIDANGGTLRDATGNDATLTLNNVGSTTFVLVDAVAPTVSSINRVSGTPTNATSVDYTVTFSEDVNGVDTADFQLTATGTASGSIASVNQISQSVYTVTVNTISGNGTLRLDLKNAGTGIDDNPGNVITTGFTSGQTYTIDTTAPAVTSVNVPANATYVASQNLDFVVNFGENVTVNTGGGTPRLALTLDTGGTVYASYLSGSGTNALVFRYAIASGVADLNGIAVAASLDANGGTLRDVATNNANLTLNSVGSTASVLVDAIAPTVGSVSVPANATYVAGQNLDFTVNFSENVTVNTGGGTPRIALTLDTGGTVNAGYLSGSGSSALVFRYTVAVGNVDGDGVTLAGSITANGGTLRDSIGNDAVLTLNSVGSTTAVLVDGVAPSVSSINRASATPTNATTLDYTVTFSENVSGVDTSDLTLTATGTAAGSIASVSAVSGSVYTVTVNSVSGDGTLRLDLKNAGTGITDTPGNAIGGGFTSGQTYALDHTVPTVASVSVPANATYFAGQNLDFTVNLSEAVTVNTGGGTPRIALTLNTGGTVYADYLSGSGTSALVLRYTVTSGNADPDGIAIAGAIDANGGTLRDASSNNLNLTLNSAGSTASVLVDAIAPTVSSVAVPASASYVAGQSLDFTVNFSEAVTVNTGGGTPRIALTLDTGGTVYANYLSGSSTTALVFRYTVAIGNVDTDGISLAGSLDANGGTLRDAIGNDATLTLNSVGSTSGVLIDAVTPTVNSVSVPANATYVAGQNLDFTVNLSEAVTVNTGGGTPRIALTLDTGGAVQANYLSGSGTNALVFRYTVASGNADANGITVGALAANGGTLQDAAGNNANLTLNGVGSTASVLVDAIVPTVTSVNVPANATYVAGQNLDFTVNLSEAVTVDASGGTPRIAVTLNTGGTVYANYLSGSGANALVFRHTVASGAADTDGIAVAAAIDVNGGTLRDAAGNNATLALNGMGSTAGVLVDAIVPIVNSVSVPSAATYIAGQNLDFAVNFSEAVTVNTGGGIPYIGLTVDTGGTVQAAYLSGSGTSTLVFRYAIAAGNVDSNGVSLAGAITANGGTIRDAATNDGTLLLNGVGSTAAVLVDAVAPTVSSINRVGSTPTNATSVAYTVTFSENSSGVDVSDFSLTATGTAAGSIASISAVSGSLYTVTVNGISGDGTVRLDLKNVGTGIADMPGNAIIGGFTAGQSYTFDHSVPTVTSVGVPSNATYLAGQNLDFTVNVSEAVVVDTSGGTPRIAITLDTGSTVYANYLSGTGTAALTFRTSVASGQLDLTGIGLGSTLDANGGTVRDAVGNNAAIALNSVGNTSGILVDAITPMVVSVAVPGAAAYNAGDALMFTVNTSEAVIVDTFGGTPRLVLDIGGVTTYANYVSGSGSSALVFSYTVQSGDTDSDGIAMNGLQSNGGTLHDAAGNNLVSTLNAVGSTSGVTFDTTAPIVTGLVRVEPAPTNVETLHYTLTFSENVTGVDPNDLQVVATGSITATIDSVTQVDSRTYMATLTNVRGSGTLRVDLNGTGTGIADAAGNALAAGVTGTTDIQGGVAPDILVAHSNQSPFPIDVDVELIALEPIVSEPIATEIIASGLSGSNYSRDISLLPLRPPSVLATTTEPLSVSSLATIVTMPAARTIDLSANGSFELATPRLRADDFSHWSVVELRTTSGAPLPGWIHYNSTTGSLQGAPPPDFRGTVQIEVVVTDSHGHRTIDTVQLRFGEAGPRASVDRPLSSEKPIEKNVAKPGLDAQFARHARGAPLDLQAARALRQLHDQRFATRLF